MVRTVDQVMTHIVIFRLAVSSAYRRPTGFVDSGPMGKRVMLILYAVLMTSGIASFRFEGFYLATCLGMLEH